ncbi:DUF4369 domain-containing protein [Marinifilum sp. D737]|uniref:DUF4369 domain-containing protein n=1 Tax=Marinifilum sp. D737 TaxID=2969628 RepID=UPI00227610AE|nr:DUF4369 domain-containing protein [Marinifilum sp. D737]MCY1636557.1 DUF4369 domain-containing protein [Marinifilum sp. D737]
MSLRLKLSVMCLLMIGILVGCGPKKQEESKFSLTGKIEGVSNSKAILISHFETGAVQDTVEVKEGTFTFKGNYEEPTHAYLSVEGVNNLLSLYVENGNMLVTGTAKDFRNSKVTGGKTQEDIDRYKSLKLDLSKSYQPLVNEYYNKNTTKKRKEEVEKELEKRTEELQEFDSKFIKENPTSYYSAILVKSKIEGKSAAEADKILNSLDSQLQKNPLIVKLKAKNDEMKSLEVGMDQLMANASNVSYKVDTKFKGAGYGNVVYLGVLTNNNICVLQKDGSIKIVKPNGKEVKSLKPEFEGAASAIAVGESNTIYLLATLQKKVRKKYRGKSYDRMVAVGVECTVLNDKGEKINKYRLEGLKTATGARVCDGTLMVADCQNKNIVMFDAKNGKKTASLERLRTCCGILDFSVNKKKEILVANLGAFRVEGFNFEGKQLLAFGQRGKELNDFHGCCNPVSVNSLSNGAIVTVEKDPTRIKIYSKEGAKQIEGIEELVTGCTYIPMTVDANDNLYLASQKKGIVKCVSVKS